MNSLSKFTFKQLNAFLIVSETTSLTRAAKQLDLTVPAVSKQIKNLEALCETALFKVIGKQVLLTEAGITLLPHAKKLKKDITSFQAKMKTNKTEAPALQLNILNTFQDQAFKYIKQFKHENPDIPLQVDITDWGTQKNAYQQNSSAIFISSESLASPTEFHIEKLDASPFAIVISPDHPLASYNDITKQHLASFTWAITQANIPSQEQHRDWLESIKAKSHMNFNSFDSIRRGAESGMVVACLPETSLAASLKAGKLMKLNVPKVSLPSSPINLTYSRKLNLNASALKWIEFMKQRDFA